MITLIFDTETINALNNLDMFDFGYVVLDNEKIIDKGSYLVKEVYGTDLFQRAYYYEKNSEEYVKKLEQKTIEIKTVAEIRDILNGLFKIYKIDVIAGFVIKFDIRVLNFNFKKYLGATSEISISKLSEKCKIVDIGLLFANKYAKIKDYKDFCMLNGYMTEKGNYKTTAEVIYRFITGKNEHSEEHTGMNDCIEEGEIFSSVMKEIDFSITHPIFQQGVDLTLRGSSAWQILK